MSITTLTRKPKRGTALVGRSLVSKGTRLYPYGFDRLTLEVVGVTQDGRLKVRPAVGGPTRTISTENARKNFRVAA